MKTNKMIEVCEDNAAELDAMLQHVKNGARKYAFNDWGEILHFAVQVMRNEKGKSNFFITVQSGELLPVSYKYSTSTIVVTLYYKRRLKRLYCVGVSKEELIPGGNPKQVSSKSLLNSNDSEEVWEDVKIRPVVVNKIKKSKFSFMTEVRDALTFFTDLKVYKIDDMKIMLRKQNSCICPVTLNVMYARWSAFIRLFDAGMNENEYEYLQVLSPEVKRNLLSMI